MSRSEATLKLKQKLLKMRKERVFYQLQLCYDISTNADKDDQRLAEFKVRYARLEANKREFEDIMYEYNEIECELDAAAEPNFQACTAYDEIYFKIQVVASTLLINEQSGEATASPNQRVTKSNPSLPKLTLPKFDGQLSSWSHFYDTYLSLIHNNDSITLVEKFHYLVSCLTGPPLTLVHSLPITSLNYPIVFMLLCDKYQNKRVLATHYLDRMFTFQPMTKPTLSNLNSFIETFYESMSALKALNITYLSEFILFYCAVRNLDSETRKLFETQHSSVEIPTFDQLISFVQDEIKITELSQTNPGKTAHENTRATMPHKSQLALTPSTRQSLVKSSGASLCALCKSDHSTHRCDQLLAMDVSARISKARALNLCTNCLRSGHSRRECLSTSNCSHCGQRHHSILHLNSNHAMVTLNDETTENPHAGSEEEQRSEPEDNSAPDESVTCHTSTGGMRTCTTVLLGTAVLQIKDASGRLQSVRALIDSAAQDTFMTTACAQRLGLPLNKCNTAISGFGCQPYESKPKGAVSCVIQTINAGTYNLEAIVIPKITTNMPQKQIPLEPRDRFKELKLADPNFDKPSPVELLLGAEMFPDIYDGQTLKVGQGFPSALHSLFGWVITGKVITAHQSPNNNSTALFTSTMNIDDTLKRFWEDAKSPPMHWPLGRVTQIHPGKDKVVRVSTVRTSTGTLVRPAVKLCPLPVS